MAISAEAASSGQITGIEERLQALSAGDVAYQLFNRNCEHAANWLFFGEARSHQVEGLLVLAGIAGLAVLASRA
jgi:hypothetical protein